MGRPKKATEHNAEQMKQDKQQLRRDENDRMAIESKFGQGKRRFGLARIMAKLAVTSEVMIMISFLVMNLEHLLSRVGYFWLYAWWRRWHIPLRIAWAARALTGHASFRYRAC